MLNRSLFRASCWMLLFVFPAATVMADTNAAMLRGKGIVSVNGNPVSQSISLFPGDRVQTGADSTASITAKGMALILSAKTQLVLEEKGILVHSGSALVMSTGALQVGKWSVAAASGERVRFGVQSQNGTLEIAALEESLSVSDGKVMFVVEPGRVLTQSKNGNSYSPPRVTNSIAAGLLLGLLAAAGLAIGLGIALSNDEASPASP